VAKEVFLRHGKIEIVDIAIAVGFHSEAHFTSVFEASSA